MRPREFRSGASRSCFNHIALASFGGGLSAWSRQMVVEQQRWMSDAEFLSAMTVCRVLPGANQVNLAMFVGAKLRGVRRRDRRGRRADRDHRC